MRKVHCIVIYDSREFKLYNVTVKTSNHNNITLFNPYLGSTPFKKYQHFKECQEIVLRLLKNNNFYVHTWVDAGAKFYDIDFCDISQTCVHRYCYETIERK